MRSARYRLAAVLLLTVVLAAFACTGSDADPAPVAGDEAAAATGDVAEEQAPYLLQQEIDYSISVTSTSFGGTFGRLDQVHTCEGRDTSPHLTWSGVPGEAKSLVLMFQDPKSDQTGGMYTHWILYSIPTTVSELAAEQPGTPALELGAKQGTNSYGNPHYSGPCPTPNIVYTTFDPRGQGNSQGFTPGKPAEERPYYFYIYALDPEVDLEPGADRNTVLEAIEGSVIAAGEVVMPYKSRKRIVRSNLGSGGIGG